MIDIQYAGSEKFGVKFLNGQLETLEAKLPLGYRFKNESDQSYFNSQGSGQLLLSFFIVLALMFLICSILFESLRQPAIVLIVIPISFIGVFVSFYLFDFRFDQGGLASFLLLSGLSVNASIFILNEYNALRSVYPKEDRIKLYLQAFQAKIAPILLTIFSTIFGFIPFVTGNTNETFWFALGVGTIGGLLFSILGIIIYLPVLTLWRKDKIKL